MKPHVPTGHVISHACLACACMALLAAAALRTAFEDAAPPARAVAAAQPPGPAKSPCHAQSCGGHARRAHPASHQPDSVQFMHLLGFSSDGEPDLRGRQSRSVALSPRAIQ
jgi:hypothetical protein